MGATSERRASSSGSLSSMTVQQNDGRDVPYTDNTYPSEKTDEEKAAPANEAPVAPDGGLVAWSVVLGAWCVSFCSFGWINSTYWWTTWDFCQLIDLLVCRCGRFSRVLPAQYVVFILCQHDCLDSLAANLFYERHG